MALDDEQHVKAVAIIRSFANSNFRDHIIHTELQMEAREFLDSIFEPPLEKLDYLRKIGAPTEKAFKTAKKIILMFVDLEINPMVSSPDGGVLLDFGDSSFIKIDAYGQVSEYQK